MTAAIRYESERTAWQRYRALVERVVAAPEIRRVCEVGGGANPLLEHSFLEAAGVDLDVLDISAEELTKAPDRYAKVQADLEDPSFAAATVYDAVFSLSVAEHIRDPATFHANVLRMLRPGGKALHFFSTLYSFPFLVNRILPEEASYRLLMRIARGRAREGPHGKFPAYYRWCRGPTGAQIARLEGVGFVVDEYVGIFGHRYYSRVPLLQRAETRVADWLVEHPVALLTSYAYVVLTKPLAP